MLSYWLAPYVTTEPSTLCVVVLCGCTPYGGWKVLGGWYASAGMLTSAVHCHSKRCAVQHSMVRVLIRRLLLLFFVLYPPHSPTLKPSGNLTKWNTIKLNAPLFHKTGCFSAELLHSGLLMNDHYLHFSVSAITFSSCQPFIEAYAFNLP